MEDLLAMVPLRKYPQSVKKSLALIDLPIFRRPRNTVDGHLSLSLCPGQPRKNARRSHKAIPFETGEALRSTSEKLSRSNPSPGSLG